MAKSESVDEEILQYFQHLSDLQKQAVLAIVRAFAARQQDYWWSVRQLGRRKVWRSIKTKGPHKWPFQIT